MLEALSFLRGVLSCAAGPFCPSFPGSVKILVLGYSSARLFELRGFLTPRTRVPQFRGLRLRFDTAILGSLLTPSVFTWYFLGATPACLHGSVCFSGFSNFVSHNWTLLVHSHWFFWAGNLNVFHVFHPPAFLVWRRAWVPPRHPPSPPIFFSFYDYMSYTCPTVFFWVLFPQPLFFKVLVERTSRYRFFPEGTEEQEPTKLWISF